MAVEVDALALEGETDLLPPAPEDPVEDLGEFCEAPRGGTDLEQKRDSEGVEGPGADGRGGGVHFCLLLAWLGWDHSLSSG